MENFSLTLEKAINFNLDGMDAISFLREFRIEDNHFRRFGNISLDFTLQEIEASSILSSIFKEDNKVCFDVDDGAFNNCVDIKKLYSHKDCGWAEYYNDALKQNAKEEFYIVMNEAIEIGNFFYAKEDSFVSNSNIIHHDFIEYLLSDVFNKYFSEYPNAAYNIIHRNYISYSVLNGKYEDFEKEFYQTFKNQKFDIDKMKQIEEQQQQEAEKEIAYNDVLLKKWKEGKISINIDISEDNLTDIIHFIKVEGDEPDFDFNEGMLKAFADENKFRIYMEDGDFSMDVYDGLPDITWNQLIGAEEIKPIEKLVELFKDGKIAIKPQSEEDIKSICDWVSEEFPKESTEIILEHVHNWDTLMYIEKDDEGNKITFDVEGDADLKIYSWEQFIGLKSLNLYSSTLKNFNSHEWVKFYEDEQGQPNVEWKEGCHNKGLEEIEGFEERVESKYGDKKEEHIYRTYMLETDKLRLAMNLPPRTIGLGGTVIKVCNFKNLINKRSEKISEWMQNFASHDENADYYVPKNMMWLLQSLAADVEDFHYLYSAQNDDDFYYDLVTVHYLCNDFAIPVPVIAKMLDVTEKSIYDCFDKHLDRDDVEFI